MFGNLDWFGEIFSGVADGNIEMNLQVAKAMVRAGLGVVIIEPGSKIPACTLLERDRRKADKEVQDAAREAGNANWDRVKHPCGINHVITDEKAFNRKAVKDLLARGANLAIAPGTGEFRVMVVDVDTATQHEAFLDDWALAVMDETPMELVPQRDIPLTVASPGVRKENGEWIHKHGGHLWMSIPEDAELPERPGKLTWCQCHQTRNALKDPETGEIKTCERAWSVYYSSGYILVPPSVRPEGPYRVTGSAMEAPPWLLELVQTAVTSPGSDGDRRELSSIPDDPIDAWSALTSWEELLSADGFTPAGYDSCGCPTWTRPGSPAHTKSVTSHEVGCSLPGMDTSMGHGPLRIWSDALGSRTMSKLTYVTEFRFGGDTGRAMRELGIQSKSRAPELEVFAELPSAKKADAPEHGATEEESEESERVDTWVPLDLTDILNGTIKPVNPTMMPREDGACLLYPGLIHSFHGESESGKSLIVMHEAVRLMQAGEDVLWITFDSDAVEDVGRALGYGCDPQAIRDHLFYVAPEDAPIESPGFEGLFQREYALAVIDGVTDAMMLLGHGGSKGDPNDAYTQFSRKFPKRLAHKTKAAVVLIDHVAKNNERGRFAIGAQAKMSQLSGAAYIVEPESPPIKGGKGTIILRVAKDRPAGVRKNCGKWNTADRTQEAARIEVDDTGEFTKFTFLSPLAVDPFDAEGDNVKVDRPDKIMVIVSEFLEGKETGVSLRGIQRAITANKERVALAVELLVNEKYVETTPGANRAILHRSVKPYEYLPPEPEESTKDTEGGAA